MKAELVDYMGTDLSVVNSARVSFAKQSRFEVIHDDASEPPILDLFEKDKKLINYLATHSHWTPFSHTAITLRMQAPIPVRTQCFKHKVGLVENEESRRYISTTPEVYVPVFREQASNKKQGSGGEFPEDKQEYLQEEYQAFVEQALRRYERFVNDYNVAEEQARFILPQGCEVNWIWTGNLVSFANFVNKRTAPDAQKEIQILAQQVSDIIQPLFPVSWKALTETK